MNERIIRLLVIVPGIAMALTDIAEATDAQPLAIALVSLIVAYLFYDYVMDDKGRKINPDAGWKRDEPDGLHPLEDIVGATTVAVTTPSRSLWMKRTPSLVLLLYLALFFSVPIIGLNVLAQGAGILSGLGLENLFGIIYWLFVVIAHHQLRKHIYHKMVPRRTNSHHRNPRSHPIA